MKVAHPGSQFVEISNVSICSTVSNEFVHKWYEYIFCCLSESIFWTNRRIGRIVQKEMCDKMWMDGGTVAKGVVSISLVSEFDAERARDCSAK